VELRDGDLCRESNLGASWVAFFPIFEIQLTVALVGYTGRSADLI